MQNTIFLNIILDKNFCRPSYSPRYLTESYLNIFMESISEDDNTESSYIVVNSSKDSIIKLELPQSKGLVHKTLSRIYKWTQKD